MNLESTFMAVSTSFCRDFVSHPYSCYTEHGLHAFFFSQLFDAIPPDERFVEHCGRKVCVVQKEYPTADRLTRSRRHHWDIAVIKSPSTPPRATPLSYDRLPLFAAAEFGLNEGDKHLKQDFERLMHPRSNLEKRFIFHFFRLSDSGSRVSARDISPQSKRFISAESLRQRAENLLAGSPVTLFLAIANETMPSMNGVWKIHEGITTEIV